jgi:hypothetical protein
MPDLQMGQYDFPGFQNALFGSAKIAERGLAVPEM